MHQQVEAVLADLRVGFQADGADLQVVEAGAGKVLIQLVALDETCWDCIVPPAVLQAIVETAVREALPAVSSVRVQDPRT